MGNIQISTANVPEGFCPEWMREKWVSELVPLLSAQLNGSFNTFNYGSSTPAPADQDKPWIRTDANGKPMGTWVFVGGFWLQENPIKPYLIVPAPSEIDITNISTYDGGEVAAVTETTGPMWQRYTLLDAKFPVGAGTFPSGSVLNIGATGGEETHILTVSELPAHHHQVLAQRLAVEDGSGAIRLAPALDSPDDSYGDTGDTGGGIGHNNIPPYAVVYWIQRTARKYYRA